MRLVICCALWGDWHLRVFKEKSLPTILHESNLPAMKKKLEVDWLFYCPKDDKRAAEFGETVSINLPDLYRTAWRYGKYEAEKRNALVMFMAPDIVWSKGSLDHIADLILSGKKTIFMTHPRGIEEVFDGTLRTGQELMKLCESRTHPVNVSQVMGNPKFTRHPEMILWKVKGGWVARMIAREPLVCDPDVQFHDSHLLPRTPVKEDEMTVVKSSDDACGVSLCPRNAEQGHYTKSKGPFDPEDLGKFLNKFPSSAGRWLSKQAVVWRYGDLDPDELANTIEKTNGVTDKVYQ